MLLWPVKETRSAGKSVSPAWLESAFLEGRGVNPHPDLVPSDSAWMDPSPLPSERRCPDPPPTPVLSALIAREPNSAFYFPARRQLSPPGPPIDCRVCTDGSQSGVRKAGRLKNRYRSLCSQVGQASAPDLRSLESSVVARPRFERAHPELAPAQAVLIFRNR